MFKRLLTYFLLFNFLNTVFFCNNEPEDYNLFSEREEIQEGEINSLVEYVVEKCLDIKDVTPEDEDDDWDDPFKTEKVGKNTNPILLFEFDLHVTYSDELPYPSYCNSTFNKVFLEIHSPPPRVA
jgi:hypothetical protein